MTVGSHRLDCIYIAASAYDARLTRICVASIRRLYPNIAVKLLAGGPLEPSLCRELAQYWDVSIADVRPGIWGWGFIKLEPLFGRPGERFLVVDSDTAVVGDVLAKWGESSADFLVDDEQQLEADTHRLYYDWRKIVAIDSAARPPQFVFNTGQWFGTAGVLIRGDFTSLVDWSGMPPRVRHPTLFTPSDQGVLNYVINQKVMRDGLAVDRRKIMHWPLHGMEGITAAIVVCGKAPPVIVHWAGLKKPKLSDMVGGDLLMFFEEFYYKRLPRPRLQRLRGVGRHAARELRTRLQIRCRMIRRVVPFMR